MTDHEPFQEEELFHYGVPGMKWGKRKGSTTTAKPKIVKGTPEHKARHESRVVVGKRVAVGVLAGIGGVTVTSIAGMAAGSAASAVINGLGSTMYEVTLHEAAFSPGFTPKR
jgi:hypothetical protein